MCDFFALLDTLIDRAIEHQPKVKDFGRPMREVLGDRPFLRTTDAPQWHSNSDLREDQRNAAAAVHVWFAEWVHPVLETVARDTDATAVIAGALPKPWVPKKKRKDCRGRVRSDSAWDKEFRSDAVFLWAVWTMWNDLVGTKWPVLSAPAYPDLEGLSVKKQKRFKTQIVTSPIVTLSLDATKFTRQATAALRWLRAAFTKHARQARDAKADGEHLALDYTDGGGIVDISCPPRPPADAPEGDRLAWLERRCKTLQACFSGPAGHYPNCEPGEAREWLEAAYSAACDWLPPATVGECAHLAPFDAADRYPSAAQEELARLARAARTRLLELHQAGGKKATDAGQAEADTPPKLSAADHEELRRMEAADPMLSEPPQYRDPTWPGVFVEGVNDFPARWMSGASPDWRANYAALAERAERMAADRRKSAPERKDARKLATLLRRYVALETPRILEGQAAREYLDEMDRVGSLMQALAVRLGFASAAQPVYVLYATVKNRVLDEKLARPKQIPMAWAAGGARQTGDEKAGGGKQRSRVKREVAERHILDHLIRRPYDTAEEVAKAVGCSVGVVAESPAWKANQDRLKTAKKQGVDPKAVKLDLKAVNVAGGTRSSQKHRADEEREARDAEIDEREKELYKQIRDYQEEYPDATPEQVAKALGCTAGDVERRQAALNSLTAQQAEEEREDKDEPDPNARRGKRRKWVGKRV